jgi:exopolysaccharide/PEP-CTERM locus tyrosine autokinase
MSLVEKALQMLQKSASGKEPEPDAGRPRVAIAARGSDGAVLRAAPRPVEEVPALPAVNVIPGAFRAAGLLVPDDEEHRFAQQYRQIKRPLIASAIGRGAPRLPNGQLILLASAMPGEGKSFTAFNLALSMSVEKDLRVLLVDADVAKPQISRLLGLDKAPGLLDVLRDPQLDIESVIVPTDIRNLWLLPAGTHSRDATELFSSVRMEEVMTAMAQHDPRRIAIIDSTPLMLTSESRVIAHMAGQVVLVVRASATPQQTVLAALRHLGEHPAVSLILNHDLAASTADYYYYGYGDRTAGPRG